MRQWFCHVCPGVDRQTLFRDLADNAVPDWFKTDGFIGRARSIAKSGKYRGLIIAMPTTGLRKPQDVARIRSYVHRLAAGFQSVGRPIVLLLCGAGDQDISSGLEKAGVLPSGKGVIGWLGENVDSGIRALALTSNYQAGICRSDRLLSDQSAKSGTVNLPLQDAIPRYHALFQALDSFIETSRPAWQPSGVFITGDLVEGTTLQSRQVNLYQELERFAGSTDLYTWPDSKEGGQKGFLTVAALFSLMVGGALAWQHGAVLRNVLQSPYLRVDDAARFWALGETLESTQGANLIAAVPGTPFETLRSESILLSKTVLLDPMRKSFELRLDGIERTALTADAETVVKRSIQFLSELSVYLKGPVQLSNLVRGEPLSTTLKHGSTNDPWWNLLASYGVIDTARAKNVPPVLSEIVANEWGVSTNWRREVVRRVQSLLETVVGYQWGVGRGPEIVAAGNSWFALNNQLSGDPETVNDTIVHDLLTTYATVADSQMQLDLLSGDTGEQDTLFAKLNAAPLLEKSWLFRLRLKASLELEAALNQVELSSSYLDETNNVVRFDGYDSGIVAQLLSLNEDRMGREILSHVGQDIVRPTADGLPSQDDISRALELGDYYRKVRNRTRGEQGGIQEVLDQSAITTMSDTLFGQGAAPRRLTSSNYGAYFKAAIRMYDMARSYSSEFGDDFHWAFTIAASRELERIDTAGQNLVSALESGLDPAKVTEISAKLQVLQNTAQDILPAIAELDTYGVLGTSPVVLRWKNSPSIENVYSLTGSKDNVCQAFGGKLGLATALANERTKTIMIENGCSSPLD